MYREMLIPREEMVFTQLRAEAGTDKRVLGYYKKEAMVHLTVEGKVRFEKLYGIMENQIILCGGDDTAMSVRRIAHALVVAVYIGNHVRVTGIKNDDFIIGAMFHDAYKFNGFNEYKEKDIHAELAANMLSMFLTDNRVIDAVSNHSGKKPYLNGDKEFKSAFHRLIVEADVVCKPYVGNEKSRQKMALKQSLANLNITELECTSNLAKNLAKRNLEFLKGIM